MRFEVYKSNGEWRFRIRAKNGKTLASGEAYKNKKDCLKTIASIKKRASDAEVVMIEEGG